MIFVPSYYENLVPGPLRASGWIHVGAFIHFIIAIIFETQIYFPGPKNNLRSVKNCRLVKCHILKLKKKKNHILAPI